MMKAETINDSKSENPNKYIASLLIMTMHYLTNTRGERNKSCNHFSDTDLNYKRKSIGRANTFSFCEIDIWFEQLRLAPMWSLNYLQLNK